MKLTPAQIDRACGVVLAAAIGDALGAPYEFGSATLTDAGAQMVGGGLAGYAPGEWTDDTAMSWGVLEVAASGADLRSDEALSRIAANFHDWFTDRPTDSGHHTRAVLAALADSPSARSMREAALARHAQIGRTAGNGSLMRTGPVALAHLGDESALVEAATKVSELTHTDPRASQACVLWSLAIQRAVLTGQFEIRAGLTHLDSDAAEFWAERIAEAERQSPSDFKPNGWVVTALQAAWSAIVNTPVPQDRPECLHLGDALNTAIAIGDDTDTVAAIAGSLLGARWGASAVPAHWRQAVHGYPDIDGERLVELAHLAAVKKPNSYGWPGVDVIDYTALTGLNRTLTRHPHDEGVWLGDVIELNDLPVGVTAVVSLCLVGRAQVPSHIEHVRFRLIDTIAAEENPNLSFVLADAARAIGDLRWKGHTVLVHCVATQSRTPAVAMAYSMLLGADFEEAWDELCDVLPHAYPNETFQDALERLNLDWL